MILDVKKITLTTAALCVLSTSALALDEFKIQKIQYQGLKRIRASTVDNYLEIQPGQTLTGQRSSKAIKALYKTGFFQAVELDQRGNTLIVRVVERGTIGSVTFKGNKDLTSEQLRAVLKQLGITKGNVYQRSAIDRFKQSLLQEYNARGKYNAQITTRAVPLTQNRIALSINVSEGRVARIKQIKFIGNHTYSSSTLRSLMQLSERGFFTYFTKKDQYNKVLLDQSLQAIKDDYMNNGYLKFSIESSQVLLAANRKSVYINIKIKEGPQYHFSGFAIAGNTIISKTTLNELVSVKSDDIFSRMKVTDSIKAIGEALGNRGYGFPSINAEPVIDEVKRRIFVTFRVLPGRHVYVRRINFSGNTNTGDYVLREVVKQNEGTLLVLSKVKESERQLRNLGFLKQVNVKTTPVPNTNNQVDLDFSVEEAPSSEASVSVGYGTNGPEFNASFNQKNFMGTGRTTGFNFNTSYWGRSYGINYYDPYYTVSGIGRGFDIFYQTVDPKKLDVSAYTSDKYGFNVNHNFLLGDTASVQFGFGLEHLKLSSLGSKPAAQLQAFADTYGRRFEQLKLTAGWTNNTYDRQPFPHSGVNQQASVLFALPVSSGSLKYYKAMYQAHAYLPIHTTGFLLTGSFNVAYGNMFNKKGLPFYENYFAGGIAQPGQVRGYESYSLGPMDSNNNNLGGNFLLNGSLGVILPHPFSQESVRTTLFVDGGNVYAKGVSGALKGSASGNLRYSAGVALDWRSPFGPLSFSLAKPIKKQAGDQSNMFQFTVMSGF